MTRPSRWAISVILGALGCTPSSAPCPVAKPALTAAVPLAIGETFTIDSHVLGERRVINVYLPPGYADHPGPAGTERFPVLYMPDGGIKEDFPHITGLVDVSIKDAVIVPLIVVGIENTERRRDLVGPTAVAKEQAIAPHAGGTERFRQFLRDELKPYIAAHYRITEQSAIIGESFAGLFVLETLLVEPTLFDSYIAVDPSVWWNQQALVRGADAQLTAWWGKLQGPASKPEGTLPLVLPPKQLFVATADDPRTQDGVAALRASIDRQQPSVGLVVHYAPLPDEHHNTIFPLAALKALRTLFALPAEPVR